MLKDTIKLCMLELRRTAVSCDSLVVSKIFIAALMLGQNVNPIHKPNLSILTQGTITVKS